MFRKIKELIIGRDLKESLHQVKKIRINGVNITIKRIDMMNYLEGHSVLFKTIDVIDNKRIDEKQLEKWARSPEYQKIKKHYIDVFMSGVVKPVLSRKDDDGTNVFVEELFTMGDLSEKLYSEIINFTYGKKKIKLNTF